ncbi:hypothetical protein Rcae01_01940 [Novipirellula caenicola]|uniref:Uncharacterized protein n=1 Tax=Novipirellula caenicola TaxID=1536901 RepID=A0ABP9VMS5_9BACT
MSANISSGTFRLLDATKEKLKIAFASTGLLSVVMRRQIVGHRVPPASWLAPLHWCSIRTSSFSSYREPPSCRKRVQTLGKSPTRLICRFPIIDL